MESSRTEEEIFEEGIQDYLKAFNAGDEVEIVCRPAATATIKCKRR